MDIDHEKLAGQTTIELTTIGRSTGEPRRIEIWWFRVEGRFVITGTPGRRDWLANALANPEVTIHVDGADLAARAVPVTDLGFRERFFTTPATAWYMNQSELEDLIDSAPMVEIFLDD